MQRGGNKERRPRVKMETASAYISATIRTRSLRCATNLSYKYLCNFHGPPIEVQADGVSAPEIPTPNLSEATAYHVLGLMALLWSKRNKAYANSKTRNNIQKFFFSMDDSSELSALL